MSLGLKRGVVELHGHDLSWKEAFETEKSVLQKELGVDALAVEHVGSTAIPGLKAKPILDLMVAVPSLDEWQKYESALKEAGYQFRTDFRTTQGHVLFVKGPEENRTHYLKLTTLQSDFWEEHVVFRDFLITHPQYRKEYEELKLSLLKQFEGNRAPYTEGKKLFIEKVLKLADYKGKLV